MHARPLLTGVLVFVLVSAPLLGRASTPSVDESPSTRPPGQGVVWAPPSHPGPALRTLDAMHARGVTAIRLESLPPADTVWARADALDLRLFVDLPTSAVSGADLETALRNARPALQKIQQLARTHPSIRAVGLGPGVDTSVRAACAPLQTWTQRVHNRSPRLHTYYVTPFTAAHDQCREAVDLLLLDTRGRDDPIERWHRWESTDATVGIGALGTWTTPDAPAGLNVPHSPQRQARHLERALSSLTDPNTVKAPPVFIYRWQDEASAFPPGRRYGLHNRAGNARPAAEVVRGFYTGQQRVFAFSSGTAPSTAPVVAILLSWVLVALLGGLYARNPFVRQTVSRYFAAHGFYRDAVQKGRDVGPIENLVLLGGVGIALGIIGALTAQISAPQPEMTLLLDALPPQVQTMIAPGLTHPTLTGLVVGGLTVVLMLVWNALLVLTAQFEGTFSMAQGLMLITWPCWPALLGMLIALVAAIRPPVPTGLLGLLLLLGGIGTILAVTIRVLRDYWAVSGVSWPWVLLLLLPSPLIVTLVGLILLVTAYDLPVSLLWHLVTRT